MPLHGLLPPPSHPQPHLLPKGPYWSQNPLCQCKSSPDFSCSTHHVTLENLQGIFHLASALEVTVTQNFLHSQAWQPLPKPVVAGEGEHRLGGADRLWRRQPCLPADSSTGFPLQALHWTWPALLLSWDQVNKRRAEELWLWHTE